MSIDFASVLGQMVEVRASDVHISPRVRRRRCASAAQITPLDDFEKLTPQDTREIVYSVLNDAQRKRFENERQLDLAYAIPGLARFRVNVFFQRGSISAAFRLIPSEIKTSTRSGCRRRSRSSPASRAASCSSPGRPARASRRRSPRWST